MVMVETDLVIDKVCIRYLYDGSPACNDEYKQLHGFKYSVLDGSLGKQGTSWSSKWAQTVVNMPLEKSALVVRYGYVHKRHWSWLQFNPAKMSGDDLALVSACLSMLFTHGASTLLEKGQLARLDVAIDAQYETWSQSLFLDASLRRSCHLALPKQSMYLGVKHGKKTMNIYDKAKEQFDTSGVVHGNDWLRIESRLRDPNRWTFGDIGNVANPFLSLLIIDRPTLMAANDPRLQVLQIACDAGMPIDEVFWQLPTPARKQAWEALQACKAGWWNPKVLWTGYQAKLDWVGALIGGEANSEFN